MATSKAFVDFILGQCAGMEVRVKPMMGEYLLYYREKYAAALCDNRVLVKNLPAARALLPDAPLEKPYPEAQDMLLVENLDDRQFLAALLEAVYPELPAPKPRRRKKA